MWPWLARAAYDASDSGTPSAADQERRDVRGGRRGQRDQPAPRADRRQHVLDGRRAEHPDGARGGLLDRLEQRVAGLLGEPVGVLDDDDLPARARRAPAPRGGPGRAPRRRRSRASRCGSRRRRRASRPAPCGTRGTRRSRRRRARCSHCSAAANATAALERPEPGGPVNSHAWLIPCPPRRGPQRLDHAALADQVVPDGHGVRPLRPGPAAARPARRTCGGDLVGWPAGRRAPGSGRGRRRPGRGTPAATRSWNSSDSPSIRSRPSNRPSPCGGVEVEHDGQVRAQVVGGPAGDVLDLGDVEVAAGALVGERRVDVAVGDDHLAAVERRLDDGLDVLGLVGGVEQRLGAVRTARRSRG